MRLPGEDLEQYRYVTLDLYAYEGEGSLKLSRLIGQLNQADYIVLSSNRIIGSVPRQPERYPMASHYYEMLLNGDLGFELVADFSQTPELFGITFDDTEAEETLTVYEHPYVRIFQKTDAFNVADVYNELDAARGYGGVNYLPGDPVGDQMFLTEAERDHLLATTDTLEWSHSLTDQIGGQTEAGFVITGLYEDAHGDHPLGQHAPTYIATRAVKPLV